MVFIPCLTQLSETNPFAQAFLASLFNLPRVSWVLSKRVHESHIELHEKYGDQVCFGPNMVSVADSAEIPTIYAMRP